MTVSAIAKAVSLPDAEQYVDASQIKTETELEFAVENFQILVVSPTTEKDDGANSEEARAYSSDDRRWCQ